MIRLLRCFTVAAVIGIKVCQAVSGINCEGSAACPLATFVHGSNNQGTNIIQGLRDALYASSVSDITAYGNGDHIVCVSNTIPVSILVGSAYVSVTLGGGIPAGGVCLFPQQLPSGTIITLRQVRILVDYLLQHGCKTCGSVPITYPGDNRLANGELTFNFVSNPACTGTCIENGAAVVGSQSSPSSSRAVATVAQTTVVSVVTSIRTLTPYSSASTTLVASAATSVQTLSLSASNTVTFVASVVMVTATPKTITSISLTTPPATVTVSVSSNVARSSYILENVWTGLASILLYCIMSML